VRLVNKFPDPPNKDVGEGLNTAFAAMRELKLKDPTIEERDHSVLVRIRHEAISPPEVLVVEYLKKNPQITNRIGRDICHIGSENAMKRVFIKLVDQGLIERVPGSVGSKTAYQRVTSQEKREKTD
jgi:ATP-dependent DNA helicase RecG